MSTITVHILDGPLPETGDSPFVAGAGAMIRFEGVVRPEENARRISALRYEVYQPMAERQLQHLARQVMEQNPGVLGLLIQHSRGRVPAGQCSFRLVVASRHRAEGLNAMGSFIDQMKQDVPIWKSAEFIVPEESPS